MQHLVKFIVFISNVSNMSIKYKYTVELLALALVVAAALPIAEYEIPDGKGDQ